VFTFRERNPDVMTLPLLVSSSRLSGSLCRQDLPQLAHENFTVTLFRGVRLSFCILPITGMIWRR
jgi:hypothetical protein